MLTRRRRTVEHRTFAAVEAGHVAAPGERRPNHTVAIDINPAWRKPSLRRVKRRILDRRRLVHLSDARLRRIVATIKSDDRAREGPGPTDPRRTVRGMGNDAIPKARYPRVERSVWSLGPRLIPRLGDLTVTVGVENGRTPTLGELLVTRLVVHSSVQPADDVPVTTKPERVVLILTELQVMRAVTGVDEYKSLPVGIVERRVSPSSTDRVILRIEIV